MKKLLSLAVLVMVSTIVFSQTTKKELEFAAELFGMEKRAMVANFVELPETNVFWSIYDEYESQRALIAEQRYQLMLEYAGNYVNYSDARLEKINAKTLNLRKTSEKLRVKYFKKIQKECGPKVASQFWMVQRYYDAAINAKILGSLPILEN